MDNSHAEEFKKPIGIPKKRSRSSGPKTDVLPTQTIQITTSSYPIFSGETLYEEPILEKGYRL